MSYTRDSGAWGGNVRIAFEYGNMPLQPNDDRDNSIGTMDNHDIALTEWNTYPEFNRNGYEGRTLEGGAAFYYPAMGFCYLDPKSREGKVESLIETLVACGVDPTLLVDATFEGGEDAYDWQGGEYVGGAIFYEYVAADDVIWYDPQSGYRLIGADLEGSVWATGFNAGEEVSVDENALYHSFVVVSNDPNKNTSGWWY